MYSRLRHTLSGKQLKIEPLQVIEFLCARMVELVDTRDLKSRGPGRVRAGSSPAPGTNIRLPELCGIARRDFISLSFVVLRGVYKQGRCARLLSFFRLHQSVDKKLRARLRQTRNLVDGNSAGLYRIRPLRFSSGRVWHTGSSFFLYRPKKTRLVSKFQAAVYCAEL